MIGSIIANALGTFEFGNGSQTPRPATVQSFPIPTPNVTPIPQADDQVPGPTTTPEPTSTPIPTHKPTPDPTATSTPSPTATPVAYIIQGLGMESAKASQELVVVDFSVDLKNVRGLEGAGSVPFRMAIDGGEPEIIHIITDFDPGEAASFVFARELTPGQHNVTFFIEDIVIDDMSINVEPATVSILPTPTPTSTLSATATPSSTPTVSATPSTPPTATSTLSATATPSSTPTVSATPSPMPTATASPTPTVASFSLRAFTNGPWLEQQDPQLASSIKKLDWIQDGIDETESEAIQDLLYIAVTSRSVVASIVSLSWVQDGIHDVEAGAFRWLNNIGSAEVASSVVSLSWVQDGIDDVEVKAIEDVSYLSYENEREALRIVGMPFLTAIDPADISALESLAGLAGFREESLEQILAHPSLAPGITDALTPIVTMLYGVAKTNPSLTELLLDPDSVSLERRSIKLPITGDVDLAIVRTGPGAVRSMDLLEHAVRTAEELMGEPLPTGYVGLLYENAVTGSFAGTNIGTHIAIRPKYDVDDGSHEAEFAPHSIAHEVAHYYWGGNADWVDEGTADFMASVIENRRTGKPVGVTNDPCTYVRTIAELEVFASDPDTDYDEFGCNYSLGERLFVDMARILGNDAVWQGLRELYIKSLVEDDADDLKGTALDIEHIREVFQSAPSASISIGRWYDGTEDYDISQLDTGPADPILTSINGRIDEAYVATSKDGSAVSSFSAQDVADWVYLTLKYSYDVSGGPHEVSLEIVEYYEDGFEFRRRRGELTAEARYIGGSAWFSVGASPPQKWAPGRYWVYIYDDDRKVAEVQYEATP